MMSRQKLAVPSRLSLPYRIETVFAGVNELDVSSFGIKMDSRLVIGLTSISGLKSLNLTDNKMHAGSWMGHVITAWVHSLTYLSMANTNVRD